MSQFIGTSMPAAFAGDITRGAFDSTVETHKNVGVEGFGIPVKLTVSGVVATTANTDTVYGFSVRGYGQVNSFGVQESNQVCVLRRGYIAVKAEGTPAVGAKVYLSAAGKVTAESSGGTAIPNAMFSRAADVEGVCEVAYNI